MKIFFKGVAPLVTYLYKPATIINEKRLDDGKYLGIRYIIHDNGSHPTAYIGIGTKHKFAGAHYDHVNINVHGGLTYSDYGTDYFLPKGYYWLGWDYAHYGDYTGHDLKNLLGNKKWTYKEILINVLQAIEQLKKL